MLADYPLTKAHRLALARAFRDHRRVDLSLDCVVEGQMGQAFTDDPEEPAVFQIQVGPFCYLAGDPRHPAGQALLKTLSPESLLMPSSPGWVEAAREVHGDRLEAFPRTSYSADRLSPSRLEGLLSRSRYAGQLERIDAALAAQVRQAPGHFVDLTSFDSAEDFVERGLGYCVRAAGQVVGAAYTSLVCSRGMEVSIYVEPAHRRRGLATALASQLVLDCLAIKVEPHWDAANIESCDLAEKLGYVRLGSYLAHYLSGDG
jgi:GNAT superfamily N-acetyltransferase